MIRGACDARSLSTDMKKSSLISWVLLFSLVFMLIYEPTIAMTGSGAMSVVLAVSFLSSLVLGKRFRWSTEFLGLFFCLIGSFVLVISISQLLALYGGGDIYLLQLLFASLFAYIPITYFIATILGHHGSATETALRLVAAVSFAQSLFIFLDWSVPGANRLFTSIVIQPESVERSFQVAGLSSATGDGLSFRQALGAMAAMHLSVIANRRRSQLAWVAVAGICLLSMVFIGRTGFVLFFAFVFVYWLSLFGRLSVVRSFLALPVVYVAIGLVVVLSTPSAQLGLLYDVVLPRAYEAVFSYLRGEGVSVSSIDVLTGRMLFLPDSLRTLFIGDGYWQNPIGPGNYVASDIGYVRSIYYVGLVGSLIVYSWYVFFWYVLRQMTASRSTRAFVNGLIAILFLSHVKFPFLYTGTTSGFCFLLLFCLYADYETRLRLTRHIRSLYHTHLREQAPAQPA